MTEDDYRMARKIASSILRATHRLPTCIDIDDLVQAGMIGALQSERTYDASKGASQATHKWRRARGAMLDEIRNALPLSRWAARHGEPMPEFVPDDMAYGIADEAESVADAVNKMQWDRLLTRSINSLPPAQREGIIRMSLREENLWNSGANCSEYYAAWGSAKLGKRRLKSMLTPHREAEAA